MKARILFCAVFLFLTNSHLQALRISMPFRLVGKMIVLPATVNGVSGNFILDTGIPHVVLNANYFEGKKVDRAYRGITGSRSAVTADYVKIQVQDLSWKAVYAEILPLQHLEQIKGIPILGLLGGKMLRSFSLWIDYAAQRIWLEKHALQWETPYFQPSPGLGMVQQSFDFKNGGPTLQLQLAGIPYQFTLDTAAETNIIDRKYQEEFASHYNLEKIKVLRGFGQTGQRISSTLLYDLKLGPFPCRPMVTTFISISQLNQGTKGPRVDGILGYEFLSQFRTCINFKTRQIYFIPDPKVQSHPLFSAKK